MSRGTLLVVISSLAFGTLALFASKSYELGFRQHELLMVRFTVASLLLWIFCLASRPKFPGKGKMIGLMAMGGLYVGQSFTFFAALKHIPASMVSLLLYLYPGIVTLAAIFLFKERMFAQKWFAVGLALMGSMLIVGASGHGNAIGVAYGLGTALFYSAYVLLGTSLLDGLDPMASSAIIITFAAVVYIVLSLISGVQVPADPHAWGWALSLAVIPTFVAITTLLAGLKLIGPVSTSTVASIEPLFTAMLSVAFLGERMTPLQLLGGACILAAVVILARASKRRDQSQAVSSATA